MVSKKLTEVLPPLPPSLKSISSYIQRAEELRTKDPIMAYWCTYYAAQMGLDLKSHEAGARDYLFALITLLEGMKKELEGNDAVEHEAAGAAYVENFALKVFTLADNEDRKGEASRSTAKKFLAAANFLELLRVFEKSNNAEVNEEKVRYAKWKASDIAKAFREGRKPMPGAARKDIEETDNSQSNYADNESARDSLIRSPTGGQPVYLAPEPSSSHASYHTPPSVHKALPSYIDATPTKKADPGTWSTVATPGSEAGGPSTSTNLAFNSALNRWRTQAENDVPLSAPELDNDGRGETKRVHFSPLVVGGISSTNGSPPSSPNIRHSDTFRRIDPTAGLQSPSGVSSFQGTDPVRTPLPESSPSASSLTSPEGTPPQHLHKPCENLTRSGPSPPDQVGKREDYAINVSGMMQNSLTCSFGQLPLQSPAPSPPTVPVGDIGGQDMPSDVSNGGSQPMSVNDPNYTPQLPNNPNLVVSSPLAMRNVGGPPTHVVMSGLPQADTSQSLPSANETWNVNKQPSPPSRYAASPPVELTLALISKAQKHCRYAISALEYEDAEQARKELRAALSLLGDR